MASFTFYCGIVLVFLSGWLEARPQNFDILKTITAGDNTDWKNDKDYAFTWKGKQKLKFYLSFVFYYSLFHLPTEQGLKF